jgi:hypothetical protein
MNIAFFSDVHGKILLAFNLCAGLAVRPISARL